ncbi:hypothetical protein GMRT_13415 [Giardia muris]|uniref:Transmembrane protein n=1 Tax=Giardia muris TaxID=5742 RepID=A0A4Z1SXF8_GIAMU|nr:hypothetical protein GMRT_13415 [Giardia muris]|eukprot:TNJ26383.1 hypothetical protein GMRT_13415 [Giardia muris]
MPFLTLDALNEAALATVIVEKPEAQITRPPRVVALRQAEAACGPEDTDNDELTEISSQELECHIYDAEYTAVHRRETLRDARAGIILTILGVLSLGGLIWFAIWGIPITVTIIWALVTGILILLAITSWIWFGLRIAHRGRDR